MPRKRMKVVSDGFKLVRSSHVTDSSKFNKCIIRVEKRRQGRKKDGEFRLCDSAWPQPEGTSPSLPTCRCHNKNEVLVKYHNH